MPDLARHHSLESVRFVEDLLGYMTPEEKFGQLSIASWDGEAGTPSQDMGESLRAGRIGSIFGIPGCASAAALQQIAVEQSRLGIPLLFAADPETAATGIPDRSFADLACWDTAAVAHAALLDARAARGRGANWLSLPVTTPGGDEANGTAQMQSAAWLAAHLGAATIDALGHISEEEVATPLVSVKLTARTEQDAARFVRRLLAQTTPDAMETTLPDEAALAFSSETVAGFPGMDIAEWAAIARLVATHAHAASPIESAIAAGELTRERLDDAVRRVLHAKFRAGLFREPLSGVRPRSVTEEVAAAEFSAARFELARKSAILLKNERGALPLGFGSGQLLVVGTPGSTGGLVAMGLDPFAIAYRQVSGLSLDRGGAGNAETVEGDPLAIAVAADAAGRAGTTIVALDPSHFEHGGAGLPRLARPAATLIGALAAVCPRLVAVVATPGPVDFSALADHCQAILFAPRADADTAAALGEILCGEADPSGRLPLDLSAPGSTADYPFGFGLSYSDFSLTDLTVEYGADRIHAEITLRNRGEREAGEVVQLYVQTPDHEERELRAYRRVRLAPGQSSRLHFELTRDELGSFDARGRRIVRAGEYAIALGINARQGVSTTIDLPAGAARVIGAGEAALGALSRTG